MIYETLSCFAGELNEFFRVKLRITEDKVVVSAIAKQDGAIAIQAENKLVLTLISLEKEPAGDLSKGDLPNAGSKSFSSFNQSPLFLSMQVLCSAYFENNYMDGLKLLAMTISFLHQKPVFTAANTPSLDPAIDKLTFDIDAVSIEQQSNIWAMLGARHMPSVLYKIQMLVFDTKTIREYRPIVEGSIVK